MKIFETYGILWRFFNPWYLTGVLKDFFSRFRKTLGNTFPKDDLAEKITTMTK